MSGAELAIVLAAVVVGSVVKSITGMGLPLIAIPIAALFVDLQDAVVVLAFPNLLANGILAWRERAHYTDTRDLPVLAGAGIVGAIIGAVAFVRLPERPLVLVLIAAIATYVVAFFAKPDLETTALTSRRWAPVVGAVAGVFQGAVGISGPIVGSWIHSYRLARGAYILAVTSLFFITGATQLVVLSATGELAGRTGATVLACIPVLGSIPIGTYLRERISSRGFDVAVIGLLVVSIATLAYQTFA